MSKLSSSCAQIVWPRAPVFNRIPRTLKIPFSTKRIDVFLVERDARVERKFHTFEITCIFSRMQREQFVKFPLALPASINFTITLEIIRTRTLTTRAVFCRRIQLDEFVQCLLVLRTLGCLHSILLWRNVCVQLDRVRVFRRRFCSLLPMKKHPPSSVLPR